ncbi:MAG TPA: hypothetical protein VFM54_15995 [Micromonosporaceae bacterium]|nr:hypothetical protein [Micromonosporaceae bacterium]
MTAPKAADARPPVPIAGVVDGQLTTVYDHDGNVCVYLTFGSGPLCDEAQVEFVLSPDDARALQRSLRDGPVDGGGPVPCRVGLRIRRGRP